MNTTHVIVVEIPKPLWKNDNGSHGNWYAHNRLMQTLKRLGWAEAADWRNRHDGVSFEHCRLDVYVQYPPNGRSRADPSNADNVGKPIIDGFTKAGLWPDDNWRHVEGPFYRMSPTIAPKGLHRLEFHITETTKRRRPAMSPQHETQRMKRQQALAVGRIDTASTLTDTLISIVNAIRDQGAPEDTFEHLTQALTGLNQTRRALAAASRSLYRHSEEQP